MGDDVNLKAVLAKTNKNTKWVTKIRPVGIRKIKTLIMWDIGVRGKRLAAFFIFSYGAC